MGKTETCDATGRAVLLWEEPLRIDARQLVEDPSIVQTVLKTSAKPAIVHGIEALLTTQTANELGFGWEPWKRFGAQTEVTKVVTPPDWTSKCPFGTVGIAPHGKHAVGHTVKQILAGEPLRIAHSTSEEKGIRHFLSKIPGFAPYTSLAYRNSDLNMYINGVGNKTALHYDREGNTNLHFCLAGKKRIIYMDHDQKHAMHKRAIISGAAFKPELRHDPSYLCGFPPIRACDIELCAGEMLYMPQRSWHYMEYEEPNISVTVPFYLSESARNSELSGPESLSWQLLTNEAGFFPFGPWIYFKLMVAVPAAMLSIPYLAAMPTLMALLLHHRMHTSARMLDAVNDALRIGVLHPLNVLCAHLIGLPKDARVAPPALAFTALAACAGLGAWQLVQRGLITPRWIAAGVAALHVVVGGCSGLLVKIAYPNLAPIEPANIVQAVAQYIVGV